LGFLAISLIACFYGLLMVFFVLFGLSLASIGEATVLRATASETHGGEKCDK
jgi:hypothetical protein